MADLLQNEETKLYEYEASKPSLEDELIHHGVSYPLKELYHYNHNHDPRNGQFTFSSGGGSGSVSSKRKNKKNKNVQIYKSNEQALEEKDYKYINEHKDQFTSKEMNELMNRIRTEEQMDKFAKERSTTGKVKKILNDPVIKTIGIAALSYATYKYIEGIGAHPKRITDKNEPYRKQFIKDVGAGAGKAVTGTLMRKAGIKKK